MRSIIVLLLSLVTLHALSKEAGQWTGHFSYSKINNIVEMNGILYCASENALFTYNVLEDFELRYSKIFKLSDIGITCLNAMPKLNYVAIGYVNGNVDLFNNGEVYNISDIKTKRIYGSKTINSIVEIDSLIYIASDLGIIVYNLDRKEVKESFFIEKNGNNLNIKDICSLDDSIFIATERGVYVSNYDSLNLSNPESWRPITEESLDCKEIEIHHGNVFFTSQTDSSSTVFIYNNGVIEEFSKIEDPYCRLRSNENLLLVINEKEVAVYDTALYVKKKIDDDFISYKKYDGTIYKGELFIGMQFEGIISDLTGKKISPPGPSSDLVSSMVARNGNIYVASGEKNFYSAGIINVYSKNNWYSKISWANQDIIDVAVTSAGDMYGASWSSGVVHFDPQDNISVLDTFTGDEYINQVRISGVEFDSKGNLWYVVYGAKKPLKVLTKEGELYEYDTHEFTKELLNDFIIDSKDRKWISVTEGILLVDDMTNFSSLGETKFIKAYDQDGHLYNDILSIAEDNDGDIWIGTDTGFGIYSSNDDVFTDNPTFMRVRIETEDDETKNMLGGTKITCITVDAANRKWMGTENSGAYLLSSNGNEIVLYLDKDNSRIPSNKIKTIAIDDETGEVFFGTDKGIVSFQSDAISTQDDFDNLDIYPNPVKPGYNKDIYIKGLVANTTIKITDLEGNLVHEIEALGGQALWDGSNLFGERVHTGVYFVFCTNEDGTKTRVGKIFFIN